MLQNIERDPRPAMGGGGGGGRAFVEGACTDLNMTTVDASLELESKNVCEIMHAAYVIRFLKVGIIGQ